MKIWLLATAPVPNVPVLEMKFTVEPGFRVKLLRVIAAQLVALEATVIVSAPLPATTLLNVTVLVAFGELAVPRGAPR
jgi:hypothetical protein